ncbi:MAG: hypothetical protein P8L31_07455 [Pseudomonadales bacterium]|nr:hypothetical protein [Pseudomonadales bacterium]
MPSKRILMLILCSIAVTACDPGTADLGDEKTPVSEESDADADADTDVNPLIGAIFVQEGGEGLASYHFDAEDYIYISYEGFDLELDNGRTGPDLKPFVSTSFELDNRSFLATIDWSDPEDTTVNGAERWVYEMIFDEEYQIIEGGSVILYDSRGDELGELDFNSDLSYERLP